MTVVLRSAFDMVPLRCNTVYTVPNSPVDRRSTQSWWLNLATSTQLTVDLLGTDFAGCRKGIRRNCPQSTIGYWMYESLDEDHELKQFFCWNS